MEGRVNASHELVTFLSKWAEMIRYDGRPACPTGPRSVQRGRSAFDDVLVEVAVDQVHVQAAGSTALGEFAGHRGSSAPAARTPGGYGDRLLLAGPARNAPTMARGDWTTSSML